MACTASKYVLLPLKHVKGPLSNQMKTKIENEHTRVFHDTLFCQIIWQISTQGRDNDKTEKFEMCLNNHL